jgi:hypothetical protein
VEQILFKHIAAWRREHPTGRRIFSYSLRREAAVDTVTLGQWAKLINEPGAWLCSAECVCVTAHASLLIILAIVQKP